jgi:glucose-6-phosphate isomerase
MVILPYKDRLELFSRYLQQLVMESLGKEKDLDGQVVHQGIAVYGNKGSTDQHAYVQQLREGVPNFFCDVHRSAASAVRPDGGELEVEPGIKTGDYLSGFLFGTRRALYEAGRESLLITVRRVDARTVGRLIALYERAVGFYASLVNINAYHQPGVEAGKKGSAGRHRVAKTGRRSAQYARRKRAHGGRNRRTNRRARQGRRRVPHSAPLGSQRTYFATQRQWRSGNVSSEELTRMGRMFR